MQLKPRSLCASVAFALCWMAAGTHAAYATNRALLIGINHYAPPAGATLPVAPAGHALDSRFAPGTTWQNLNGPSVDVSAMQVLLKNTYQFNDVRVLPEEQATRAGILAALDQLVAETQPGDLVVFYYAGHGSQRLDTLSSKNHLDETIVPIDAWKGAEDIRDKELAMRFNKIVYDRQARLTAIYDSCHSGTMARGITESVQRTLPYDDRDVAGEKKNDATTITEGDLKHIPQNGNAIILAAASSTESAVEARYPDDHQFHGAFTRALVRVLQASTQNLSAEDVVAEVSSLMHADRVPPQQPSVEGRVHESLFGAPVAAHALHVHVTAITGAKITLDIGSAGGFDAGTQFRAIEADALGNKALIEVKTVTEPLVSTAELIDGSPGKPAMVKVGQIFELTSMAYPHAARLVLFASKPSVSGAAAATAKAKFPGLTWVDDPALQPINFLVVEGSGGWTAYGQDGKQVAPGAAASGPAYLLLGPLPSVLAMLQQSPPFEHKAFTFTDDLAQADYLLARRTGKTGKQEYTLFNPGVLAPRKPAAYLTSEENDPDDTAVNGGVPPEVVCRNDVSLPVRTAWLPAASPQSDEIVTALNRRIVRLGKLRVWLQSPALASGAGGWPYHLAITQPNSGTTLAGTTLRRDQPYTVMVKATADEMAKATPVPKYIYLFGFDCAANPFLLYPGENTNGDATFPQAGEGGAYPRSFTLIDEKVGTPVGADTLFFLATKQKIGNLQLLMNDGVLSSTSRGAGGGFDQLITDMSDAGTRGPVSVPTDWLVQQLVVPSKP